MTEANRTENLRCGDTLTWKSQKLICNRNYGHDGDHVSGLNSWVRGPKPSETAVQVEALPSNPLVQRLREYYAEDVSEILMLAEAADALERQAGVLQRLPAQLNNVSAWLNNGCDPKHAATELGLIASRLQALAAATADEEEDPPEFVDCGDGGPPIEL